MQPSSKKISCLHLDQDMISDSVSYSDLVDPRDAKECLDNTSRWEVCDSGISTEQSQQHLDIPTSILHAYVKPPSNEVSVSGAKKQLKTPKVAQVPWKKAGKVDLPAEASTGSTVLLLFQQGMLVSSALSHVSNCLSCGKIVCEQEGEGPCIFCGAFVLREGSTCAVWMNVSLMSSHLLRQQLKLMQRDSLSMIEAQDPVQESVMTKVTTLKLRGSGNSWLSEEEIERLKEKQEQIKEAERIKQNRVFLNGDDELAELESESSKLKPLDEREVNRNTPNPSLKVQPRFVDLGRPCELRRKQ